MYDLHINTAHQGRMSRVYKPLDNCVVQYLTMHRWIYNIVFSDRFSCTPRSGELRTQKLKSHLARTQSLSILPLKTGVGHTCYAYCQGFLSCLFLHFRSIHLHFFQNISQLFPVLAVANTWFLCRPAE